jgi:AcrR family transcriptional regulator
MPRVSPAYLESRRRQILAAAVRCFSRQGFHRATMQDVVREAALSPGAIYRYYASKEEIIAAVAAERHAAERELLRTATRDADLGAGFEGLARAFLGRLSTRDEKEWRRVTVQLWGEALRSKRVMAVVRGGLDEPLALLAALVRRGRREGRLSPALEPRATARVAAALFQGLALQQAWEPDMNLAACVRSATLLLRQLVGPPRRRRPAARPR